MTSLLENPLPIWIAGAVLGVFAAIVLASRRNLASLVALIAIVALTLTLVAIERAVQTPREQVEAAMTGVLEAIEANDLPAVLAFVDREATTVRSDAETAMPLVTIDRANIEGTLTIELEPPTGDPTDAVARFRAIVIGKLRRGGATIGFRDQVEVHWKRRDDRWLVDGYAIYEDGQRIDAVGRARRGAR